MWTNTQDDLIQGIKNHGPGILEYCDSAHLLGEYLAIIDSEKLDYPRPKSKIDPANWFMPDEYKSFDLAEFLHTRVCEETGYGIDDSAVIDTAEHVRMVKELQEFENRNLLPLLRQMKYIIDTLRKNNIMWGVGRGSSVSSYVLYLLDVHRINSVKYDLPLNEFFKGENNG